MFLLAILLLMKLFRFLCLSGLLTIFFIPTNVKGQKKPTDCYLMLYQVDQLLKSGDTLMAISLFDALDEDNCDLNGHRYYKMSKVLYHQGAIEDAKVLIKKGVEEGLLGIEHFYEVKNSESIRELYGDIFYEEMMQLNDSLVKATLKQHGELIYALRDILEYDQAIRSVEKYHVARGYEFAYRLGLSYDSTLNHKQVMEDFAEYHHKDSVNLQKFVDIIAGLGYIPGRDMVFDLVPIPPLVFHTAKTNFQGLESFYKTSVAKGTLSPAYYGVYHSYYAEYFQKKDLLYFTYGDKLFNSKSDEEIKEINKKRLEIGLPPCPAVAWNTQGY